MVNLAAEKSFRICLYLLEKRVFTQYGVKKALGTGMNVVNSVFQYLVEKKLVAKEEGHYALKDPEGLCLALSYFRDMGAQQLFSVQTGLDKRKLVKLLPADAVFCLETALAEYGNYFETADVNAYVSEADVKKVKTGLFLPGKKSTLTLYQKKPSLDGQVNAKKQCTSALRTAVDLFCANKAGLGAKLLNQFHRVGP